MSSSCAARTAASPCARPTWGPAIESRSIWEGGSEAAALRDCVLFAAASRADPRRAGFGAGGQGGADSTEGDSRAVGRGKRRRTRRYAHDGGRLAPRAEVLRQQLPPPGSPREVAARRGALRRRRGQTENVGAPLLRKHLGQGHERHPGPAEVPDRDGE